ncbi:hypothetical protein [Paraburkholderia aromaticivorans]|uniref:Uncharacterized protein n=1 Tax=Paraburkholderia aromaticivorans TaxID=2026199 RepID=A0A248VZ71_9BURK|nr:hypothetical protein [Paraburkholderia aromaticivorans]ASW03690.1 hypothetical protein CJU94_36435 [Paraburkholderia aromaticivorans]
MIHVKTGFGTDVTAAFRAVAEQAAGAFWKQVTIGFPEVTTGDSLLSGEDEGAMYLWLTGKVGDYPQDECIDKAPSCVDAARVDLVVETSLQAAASVLKQCNPELTEAPDSVRSLLASCVRHQLRWNYPSGGEIAGHKQDLLARGLKVEGSGESNTESDRPANEFTDTGRLNSSGDQPRSGGASTELLVRDRVDMPTWKDLDPEVADLPVSTHVGGVVSELLTQLQGIILTQTEMESEYIQQLKEIGRRQSEIWLFG